MELLKTKYLLVTATALIVYAIYVLLVHGRGSASEKKRIALETLSMLWSKRKEVSVTVEELSRLWKEENRHRTQRVPPPEFKREEIRRFYAGHIENKTFFAGASGDVVRELLKLLDEDGDCPSVVQRAGDREWDIFSNDMSAYNVLAAVPLYLHALGVATRLAASVGRGPVVAKAVIVALAHDIGKLPTFKKSPLYSMGDHPLISAGALEMIDGFKSLPYRDEVIKAVKEHHLGGRLKLRLSIRLREADQAERAAEMAAAAKQMRTAETAPAVENSTTVEIEAALAPPAGAEGSTGSIAEAFGGGEEETQKDKIVVQEVEMPWFDFDEFVRELRPEINRIENGRWSAFSMPDGIVYIQPNMLWRTAQTIARRRGDMSLTAAGGDETFRRNVIFSVVRKFREKGGVPDGILGDTFFSAKYKMKMRKKDGSVKEFKPSYTPFKAEAFAGRVSELEAKKEGTMLKDIFEVLPRSNDDE